MYLDQIISGQKSGRAVGIPSICSANPSVLKVCVQSKHSPLLIESTCNQVNQFGGYTGLTPADFVEFVVKLAAENGYPVEQIIFGGDHLGPSVWQDECEASAMEKAEVLIKEYVEAGYKKIHLDCSMRLGDDPAGPIKPIVSASRAARLAKIAELHGSVELRYVIGTEVPLPGGATEHEDGVSVTSVKDLEWTIETTRQAFIQEGLDEAWKRVIAVVVQPGVEYGDDFILPYLRTKARDLSSFIEGHSMVYEAHSTDYQTRENLKSLVQDHFAILKVGPALTFAFREAVFGLAMIEGEILKPGDQSNIISLLDRVMVENPVYWEKYYQGNEEAISYKRLYSLSDRIRYYWSDPRVKGALERMISSLTSQTIPLLLVNRFFPEINPEHLEGSIAPDQIINRKIHSVLDDYYYACQG